MGCERLIDECIEEPRKQSRHLEDRRASSRCLSLVIFGSEEYLFIAVIVVFLFFFCDPLVELLFIVNQFANEHLVVAGVSIILFGFLILVLKVIDSPPTAATVVVLQHLCQAFSIIIFLVIQVAHVFVFVIL